MRAAIILAAGASRRFGRRDKLQARLGGRTLLEHVIAHARASGARRILLVGGKRHGIRGLVALRPPPGRKRLSASLAKGLGALRPVEREVLVFLADMPFAHAPRMQLRQGFDAVRPAFRGAPGHPVLMRTQAARAALGSGDAGLGGRLRTAFVPGTPAHLIDIDTPEALRRLRRHGSRVVGLRC
jgi:molybdenum cofactor cytidylyltransferase